MILFLTWNRKHSLGGVVLIDTDSVSIPSNTTKTIVSIAKTYTSAKFL